MVKEDDIFRPDGGSVKPILPAYRQVADQLLSLIIDGEVKPGERLPTEETLAKTFAVSRSTIREALRSLAAESFVETSRGPTGGSFVVAPGPQIISTYLQTRFAQMSGLDLVTLPELLEVREMLEVPIAGLAAKNRTDEHISMLRASIGIESTDASHSTLTGKGAPHFHTTLLHAAGNPLLSIMTPPIFHVLALKYFREDPPNFWKLISEQHEAIADAVENGDSRAAEDAMRHHLEFLGDACHPPVTMKNK